MATMILVSATVHFVSGTYSDLGFLGLGLDNIVLFYCLFESMDEFNLNL